MIYRHIYSFTSVCSSRSLAQSYWHSTIEALRSPIAVSKWAAHLHGTMDAKDFEWIYGNEAKLPVFKKEMVQACRTGNLCRLQQI